jgi:small subunit ribosomal protein S6
MRSYECAVIIAPGADEESLAAVVRKYSLVVAGEGGEMTAVETWGKRRLAYEIQHNSEGHYFFFKFRSEESALKELERQLHIDESAIRHMIVRDEKASADAPVVDAEKIEAVKTGEPQEVRYSGETR